MEQKPFQMIIVLLLLFTGVLVIYSFDEEIITFLKRNLKNVLWIVIIISVIYGLYYIYKLLVMIKSNTMRIPEPDEYDNFYPDRDGIWQVELVVISISFFCKKNPQRFGTILSSITG